MMDIVLRTLGEAAMIVSPLVLAVVAVWVMDVAVPFAKALRRWYVDEWRPNRRPFLSEE